MISEAPKSVLRDDTPERQDVARIRCGWLHESMEQLGCRIGHRRLRGREQISMRSFGHPFFVGPDVQEAALAAELLEESRLAGLVVRA